MSPPEPAQRYRLNMPVPDLQTVELLLVTSLRLWVERLQAPSQASLDWRSGFERAGLDGEAQHHFDLLFRVVAATAQRNIDVRCPRCPRLGEDEGWFLQAIALLQTGRAREARAILSLWLPAAALQRGFDHAESLARCLQVAGLLIPERPDEGLLQREEAARIYADRGLALVQ